MYLHCHPVTLQFLDLNLTRKSKGERTEVTERRQSGSKVQSCAGPAVLSGGCGKGRDSAVTDRWWPNSGSLPSEAYTGPSASS